MKIDKEAKEKLDYLASSICDKYCRYPFIWDEAKYGSLIDSEICCHCPLTMFEQYVEVEGDCVPSNAREEAKCDDVVSRQAIKKLKRHNLVEGQLVSLYDIEQLPSVRPQEQTGHWIYKNLKGQFCSICDEQSVWKFNYCPNCGACMKDGRTLDEFIEDSKEGGKQ